MLSPTHGKGIHGKSRHVLTQLARLFDTPGYFSRGIDEFKAFGEAWYGEKYATGKPKVKSSVHAALFCGCSIGSWLTMYQPLAHVIYLPDRFEPFPQEKVLFMASFIDDLTLTTHSIQTYPNVAELWRNFSPEGHVPIDEYLQTVYMLSQSKFKSKTAHCQFRHLLTSSSGIATTTI